MSRLFHGHGINQQYNADREHGVENVKHRDKVNASSEVDMEAVDRRRRREAFEEAKRMRMMDELDQEWGELWKIESN